MTTTFQFTTTLERPNASGSEIIDEEITVSVRVEPYENSLGEPHYSGHDIGITCQHEHKDSPPLSRVEWDDLHEKAREKWRNGDYRTRADVTCDDRDGK